MNSHKIIRGVLAITLSLLASSASVMAHGGEDHSEAAPVVQVGAGMQTRTARAGEWEVSIKHPVIEPDKEMVARVFVTRFETNEPIGGASVFLRFGDGSVQEIAATAGATAGVYEVKLPPVPKGQYALTARVEAGNASETVQFGKVDVTTPPPAAIESSNSWARTGLIVLAALAALMVLGVVGYRLSQGRGRGGIKEEAVTA